MNTLRHLIHEFLSLVEDGGNSVEANERRLIELCDRLALASHLQREQGEAGEYGQIPERDWQRTRRLVEQRFPRYGHYNAIRPVSIEIGSAERMVGDAIDDLTDIVDQLAAVEWCFGHTSEADALWHFFDGFDHHWGEHLRALQLYLHCQSRKL